MVQFLLLEWIWKKIVHWFNYPPKQQPHLGKKNSTKSAHGTNFIIRIDFKNDEKNKNDIFCTISFIELLNYLLWLIFSSPSCCHHLAPVIVVRHKLFQKSSPLKVPEQLKPNLVWIITRVSSVKIVSGNAVHQPTWPLLLKIEHVVKLQVFG